MANCLYRRWERDPVTSEEARSIEGARVPGGAPACLLLITQGEAGREAVCIAPGENNLTCGVEGARLHDFCEHVMMFASP